MRTGGEAKKAQTKKGIFMLVLKNCRLIPALTEGCGLTVADLVLDL